MRLDIAARIVNTPSRASRRPRLFLPPRTKHRRVPPTIIGLDAQTTSRIVPHALQHHATKRLIADHLPRTPTTTRPILATHPHTLRKPSAVLSRPTTLTALRATHRIAVPRSTVRIAGTTLTVRTHGADGQSHGVSLPTDATRGTLERHRKVLPTDRPSMRLQDAALSNLHRVRRTHAGFASDQQRHYRDQSIPHPAHREPPVQLQQPCTLIGSRDLELLERRYEFQRGLGLPLAPPPPPPEVPAVVTFGKHTCAVPLMTQTDPGSQSEAPKQVTLHTGCTALPLQSTSR